uniref:Reverse transcriptase domain-containing protein n=1 Tax=Leptobrachium leishanense TaxID=445787 RepID=A0A8C5LVW1_9ANUR
MAGHSTLKVFSMNTKGLNIPHKRHSLYTDLKSTSPDVVCLQETHFKRQAHPRLYLPQYTTQLHAMSSTKSRGVSILIHKRVAFQMHRKVVDPNGRFLLLVCSLNHKVYTIANIYCPNESQRPFLGKVLTRLEGISSGTQIVCGDLNLTMDIPTQASKRQRKEGLQNKAVLAGHRLFDVWRLFHPGEVGHTFFSMAHKIYSRIDYVLVQGETLNRIRDCSIGTISWSDHAPVTIELSDCYDARGKAPWRLNESLLARVDVREEISQALVHYFNENGSTEVPVGTVWQAHKAVIRGILIKWGSRLKRQHTEQRLTLLKDIDRADVTHKQMQTGDSLTKVTDLRNQLVDMDKRDYSWAIRRLKAKCYIYSNKASKMLANKLRARAGHSRISQIMDTNGNLHYQPRHIAGCFADYYEALYNLGRDESTHSPTLPDIVPYLQNLHLPSLTDDMGDRLTTPITPTELLSVLRSLPEGKAPGPDGFTAKYYKSFADTLHPHMLSVYQDIFTTGHTPGEWLNAHIITLPKTTSPSQLCSQYRPISLLNVDTKLYAKILANRLAEIMPTLVADDQVGFIKGRQGPDNTLKTLTLMEQVTRQKQPTLILSLDAEKAFDRVNWLFLRHVLLKFGFPAPFITAIFSLYTHPRAKIIQAGFSSRDIAISNGTRQGCPLSPLLYALVLEPLAQAIRQSTEIRGVDVGPTQCKLSLFADDILLMLTDPATSIPALHTVLEDYGRVSFHKINVKKSQALPYLIPREVITPLRNLFPYEWRTSHLKYLGIQISFSQTELFQYNYKPLIMEIGRLCHKWSGWRCPGWDAWQQLKCLCFRNLSTFSGLCQCGYLGATSRPFKGCSQDSYGEGRGRE